MTSATTSMGMTQHHVFIELERVHPIAILKQAVRYMRGQRCSILIQPPQSCDDAGEKALVLLYNVIITDTLHSL